IADQQALTDNAENPKKIQDSLFEVGIDYLAVGIDPGKSTIFIQSQIPQLPERTVYYLNLVTVARLERNPTIKSEIKQKGLEKKKKCIDKCLTAVYLVNAVSIATYITSFKRRHVPVGDEQKTMLE